MLLGVLAAEIAIGLAALAVAVWRLDRESSPSRVATTSRPRNLLGLPAHDARQEQRQAATPV
jgi:hypothetical protein